MKDVSLTQEIMIVIVVRDRFSMFKKCLEAVYEHTTLPFRVMVVVGGADQETEAFLSEFQAKNSNFKLILREHLLMQGEARNIALNHFDERYCVMLENDTLVHENWLAPLFSCLLEEKAAVTTPLMYWHRGVHSTGGKFVHYQKDGKPQFKNKILYEDFIRKPIDYPENHCILLDRHQFSEGNIFDDVEPFDVDLGLALMRSGLTVYFEPRSVATYSAPPLWEIRDIAPFSFRWDPETWKVRNQAFMQKWSLTYEPSRKLASYHRQQVKVWLAKKFPGQMTLSVSNVGVKYLNLLHTSISQLPFLKRKSA